MHLADKTLLQGGKYRIVRFIASGGFGCTYEAVQTLLGQRVAIKEYFFNDFSERESTSPCVSVTDSRKKEIVDRFRRKFIDEARNLWNYKHPGIVTVFDVFEENGTAYYVMDYIDGKSLGQMVKERGPLPEDEALGYIRQVCDALAYVHARGRLHLDIKPANIMVDASGKALLIDFGASKQFDEQTGTESTTTPLMRSPGYAPIEQVEGLLHDLRASTDIYALGATLYKLLTGVTPPLATLRAADADELPPLPPAVSPGVQQAIHAAMQISRRKRPQSVAEFLAIIDGGANRPSAPLQDSEDTEVSPASSAMSSVTFCPSCGSQVAPGSTFCTGCGTRIDSAPQAPAQPLPPQQPVDKPKTTKGKPSKKIKSASTPAPTKPATTPPVEVKKKSKAGRNILIACWLIALAVGLYLFFAKDRVDYAQGDQAPVEGTVVVTTSYSDDGKMIVNINDVGNALPLASFTMVPVAGGKFTMGATGKLAEGAQTNEKPTHEVTLQDYMIGETEVTQKVWKAVMGDNPSEFKGDNLPVEKVSWNYCQQFIKKLNELTGKNFRLPTEAEWEYAAKGGRKAHGYIYSGSDDIDDVAWYDYVSYSKTQPVATKKPNELGIYDMSGNVCEWCNDWYGAYRSESQKNPTGPASGSARVYRGGSWSYTPYGCRSSYRGFTEPYGTSGNTGFRLALFP